MKLVYATALLILVANVFSTEYTAENAKDFLTKFGYENPHTVYGPVDETIAIKKAQKYAGIPESGVIDEATLNVMNSNRCGVSDGHDGPARLGTLYPKNKHFRYRFENFSPDIGEAATRSVIKRALTMWSDATTLTFSETSSKYTYDITIRFEGGKHGNCHFVFDGPGKVIAHAFYPRDGRVHFDEAETFTVNGNGGTNLAWVAAHEFGHTLGLDHSPDSDAVMYAYYGSQAGSGSLLGSDDISKIQSYYGRNPSKYGSRSGQHKYCDADLEKKWNVVCGKTRARDETTGDILTSADEAKHFLRHSRKRRGVDESLTEECCEELCDDHEIWETCPGN